MDYIHNICQENDIQYFIMGGTALGAIRHKGFIPWDDDLDIFMTYENYILFKKQFLKLKNEEFVLQEWSESKKYLEYSKVRMNGTTFIEKSFANRKNMHHGIYVDIMILHKVPNNFFIQKMNYIKSKYITLHSLTKRNWKPKSIYQRLAIILVKFLPNFILINWFYKSIYKYDCLSENFKYCYWITPAKFKQGLFERSIFDNSIKILFNNRFYFAPVKIKDYLVLRYGDYMKLPPLEKQKEDIHAEIFDVSKNYTEYM